eukprot:scaffold73_cov337-Pavlova_lutheri.AAC.66
MSKPMAETWDPPSLSSAHMLEPLPFRGTSSVRRMVPRADAAEEREACMGLGQLSGIEGGEGGGAKMALDKAVLPCT